LCPLSLTFLTSAISSACMMGLKLSIFTGSPP
jgi:hypothetical protein